MREYLVNLRKSLKLTLADTAKKLDISESYYKLIEDGERQQDIRLDTLVKLASAFNISLTKLVEMENQYKSSCK